MVSAPGQNRRQGSTSTDWTLGLLVKTSKSWRYGAASPGQHDILHFHKLGGGTQIGFSYQSSGGSGENIPELSRFVRGLNSSEQSSSNCAPSPYVRRVLVMSSCQERAHYSPTSVDLHTGEHRGRLFSADTVCRGGTALSEFRWIARDCKSGPHWMQVSSRSHQIPRYDLGGGFQGYGNLCPGLLLGSSNLAIPPGPSHSSGTGEGFRAADRGDFNVSGVKGSNVVVLVGQTED